MKMVALAALCAVAGAASAQTTYTDSQNELFNNGLGHLDFTSVVVNHDASNLYFTINLRSSAIDTNWGKYCIGINTAGSSVNSVGNGWGRNVSWGSGQGIDYWIGTWADGPGFGGEIRQMTDSAGNGNSLISATYLPGPTISGNVGGTAITITLSRASLGLIGDQSFTFDVISTGSNFDPGVDHLSRSDSSTSDWGVQSTAGQFLTYTIPTPGSMALLGLAGLVAGRRRR
jgi:uncharacterized protein (TIGR03382 family)